MTRVSALAAGAALALILARTAGAEPPDRTELPIRGPDLEPSRVLDVRDASPPPRWEVRAPPGAPNVLVVVLDDVGFGQPSTFGGGVEMPTLDRLASEGLRYVQFHTAGLCSPTRAALATGRDPHVAEAGSVMELASGFPGHTGARPPEVAPLAEILRLNGYRTAAFGKWHETPPWELTPTGPFDLWPTSSGFEHFYGFLGGETNQWSPVLVEGTRRAEAPPGEHLTTVLADRAIGWLQAREALAPDAPFFLSFAPGAAHAPHHAPREWIDRYRGRFDEGWDAYREQTLARQRELGVVPPRTRLAEKPAAIPDWEDLPAEEQALHARQMEVFAGFLSHADHEVGRVVAALEELGELDRTVVVVLAGDNGASAEGGRHGYFNDHAWKEGVEEPLEVQLGRSDELGGPTAFGHYAAGWAVAGDTPFAWTKQVASDFGGTRNGLVVRYPPGIEAPGGIRTQWHHVVDVAPTVLELAGIPEPRKVNGVTQRPMDGVSLAYTLSDPEAPDRRREQLFELFGNRAIYEDGWFARTVHVEPWSEEPLRPLAEDVWELFDTRADPSLIRDLARREPERLVRLRERFLERAAASRGLPLDDRRVGLRDPGTTGRPRPMAGRTSITLPGGVVGLGSEAFLSLVNRSSVVEAVVRVEEPGASGAVLAQGGRFGGWSLHLRGGRPAFAYNWLGMERAEVIADQPLEAGEHRLRWEFAYDGGGPGRGGLGRLWSDGAVVAEGRIERTHRGGFGLDETADVGTDLGTPVTEVYAPDPSFPGEVLEVRVEVGPVEVGPVSQAGE